MKAKKKINWKKAAKRLARAIVRMENDYMASHVGERTEMLARKISKMN